MLLKSAPRLIAVSRPQRANAEQFTLKQVDHGTGAEHRCGHRSAGGGAGSNLEERGARLKRGILTIAFRLR